MWHQLGPPVRRQSPVRALCSVIASFMLLSSMLTNFMIYQARALRALGLLLADGTPTVGGGKTF